MSVRPGPMGCLGLRELHMVPYRQPEEEDGDTESETVAQCKPSIITSCKCQY